MIDGRVSLVRMSTGEIIDKFNDHKVSLKKMHIDLISYL